MLLVTNEVTTKYHVQTTQLLVRIHKVFRGHIVLEQFSIDLNLSRAE